MAIAVHRKFIAGIATAAILITAIGTNQAHAGDRDRALAALLGLAVVGAIVANNYNDRQNGSNTVTRNLDTFIPNVVIPRPLPQRARRVNLPGQCLREVETRRGNVARILGGRCMYRNYQNVQSLPRSCETQVRGWNGRTVSGWGVRCLRQNGYRVAGGGNSQGQRAVRYYDDDDRYDD